MTEKRRELLGIDPTTVVAGAVYWSLSTITETCPLAKGRDGSWYAFIDLATRYFGIAKVDAEGRLVVGFSDNIKGRYEQYFSTPDAKQWFALGIAAKVISLNPPKVVYDHHDLGLWRKIKEGDELAIVYRVYDIRVGITSEKIK